MEKYEGIENALKKEIKALDTKYSSGVEMSKEELDRLDKLTHTMKSLAGYYKIMYDLKECEESEEMMNGYSGRRNRAMNGQYSQSYSDGYSHGYNEAMRQSGRGYEHYPLWSNNPYN